MQPAQLGAADPWSALPTPSAREPADFAAVLGNRRVTALERERILLGGLAVAEPVPGHCPTGFVPC